MTEKLTAEDEVLVKRLLGQEVPPSRPIGLPPSVKTLLDDVDSFLEINDDHFLWRDEF